MNLEQEFYVLHETNKKKDIHGIAVPKFIW